MMPYLSGNAPFSPAAQGLNSSQTTFPHLTFFISPEGSPITVILMGPSPVAGVPNFLIQLILYYYNRDSHEITLVIVLQPWYINMMAPSCFSSHLLNGGLKMALQAFLHRSGLFYMWISEMMHYAILPSMANEWMLKRLWKPWNLF